MQPWLNIAVEMHGTNSVLTRCQKQGLQTKLADYYMIVSWRAIGYENEAPNKILLYHGWRKLYNKYYQSRILRNSKPGLMWSKFEGYCEKDNCIIRF